VSNNKPYSASQKKYTFAIQPFQAFNWAWRFDVEMRLGDGPGWLQFGPSIYSATRDVHNPRYHFEGKYYSDYRTHDSYLREPFSKLKGGGLDVNYKRFFNRERSLYLAAGLSYTRLKINYWGYEWENFTEDDLQYHEYRKGYHTQQIDRIGINTFFGYQIPTRSALLFDMFTGIAYRHSFLEKDRPCFNESQFSYGYTGPVFTLGVRLGFGIR
jgi:hypothetical protein